MAQTDVNRDQRSTRSVSRGWLAARSVGVAALIVLGCELRPAGGADLSGARVAAEEAGAAAQSIVVVISQLPVTVRERLGIDVRVLAQATSDTARMIDAQAVPIADQSVIQELEYLADILRALESELAAVEQQEGLPLDQAAASRIGRLSTAGLARVEQLDGSLADWSERTRDAVVEVHTEPGVIAIRSIDRSVYNRVRYVALALLAIGLLAVGVQLLRMLMQRVAVDRLIRDRPILAAAALGSLAVFFVATSLVAMAPGWLAGLSAKVEIERVAHACQRLETERARLASAWAVDNVMLIEATERRLQRAANNCMGLPEVAVVPAVAEVAEGGGLASANALTRAPADDVVPDRTPDVPAAQPNVVAGATAPVVGDPEAARGDRAILRELLASLQLPAEADIEPPASESLDSGPAPEAAARPAPAAAEVPAPLVTTTAVNYRAGPGIEATRLGTLVAGARVDVVRQESGWAEIRLRDGRHVFVASEFLEPAP